MYFVVLLGIVSLLGDIAYEGARSVMGPYLGILGADASLIGLIVGIGELSGYALRLLSGYLADRLKIYWALVFVGYGLLVSMPLLALASHWEVAALLFILERIGKAIRTPARDTLLSHATKKVGRGWGFAVHEALDQIGAIIGPLIFSLAFLSHMGYRQGFALLGMPVLLLLVTLSLARRKFPLPFMLEVDEEPGKPVKESKLPRVFWFYVVFTLFSVAGFVNFPLISYHIKTQSLMADAQIPVIYAIAMAVDGVAALIVGRVYDKIGIASLVIIPLLSLAIPPLVFGASVKLVFIGMVLWGVVLGIQETIMRAAIADLAPLGRRGFAYGMFNTIHGVALFTGSAVLGMLYELCSSYIFIFVVITELVSIFFLFRLRRAV